MAGSRHDWALYTDSDMDSQLQHVCTVDSEQYFIHSDSGYSRRSYLDLPLVGINLSPAKKAANKCTGSVRVKMEWEYTEVKLYRTFS